MCVSATMVLSQHCDPSAALTPLSAGSSAPPPAEPPPGPAGPTTPGEVASRRSTYTTRSGLCLLYALRAHGVRVRHVEVWGLGSGALASVRVRACVHVRTCVCACVCARVNVCAHACVCAMDGVLFVVKFWLWMRSAHTPRKLRTCCVLGACRGKRAPGLGSSSFCRAKQCTNLPVLPGLHRPCAGTSRPIAQSGLHKTYSLEAYLKANCAVRAPQDIFSGSLPQGQLRSLGSTRHILWTPTSRPIAQSGLHKIYSLDAYLKANCAVWAPQDIFSGSLPQGQLRSLGITRHSLEAYKEAFQSTNRGATSGPRPKPRWSGLMAPPLTATSHPE